MGLFFGLFAAISLGVLMAFMLVVSHREACRDPRIPCIPGNEAMLDRGLVIVWVMAGVFGLIMGLLAAYILPRVRASAGSGCAILLGLGVVCLTTLAMLVSGLEMLESMLWSSR